MVCRIFLADDEPLICDELRYILEQDNGLEIVGQCHMGSRILDLVKGCRPHVVFLDINMPGCSGMEVAHALTREKKPPLIVFITAYEEYAVEAFKVHAIGYILKPFNSEDIKIIIQNVKQHLQTRNEYLKTVDDVIDELNRTRFKRVQGEKEGRLCLIDPQEISAIMVKGKKTMIITLDWEYVSNQPLSVLEAKLSVEGFFRCHRNFLVNLKRIKEIIPWFNGSSLLVMEGYKRLEIPVSKYRIKELKELIDL